MAGRVIKVYFRKVFISVTLLRNEQNAWTKRDRGKFGAEKNLIKVNVTQTVIYVKKKKQKRRNRNNNSSLDKNEHFVT